MNNPPSDVSPYPTQEPRMVRAERRREQPIVVYSLIGITVFVYFLQYLTQSGYLIEPFIALGNAIMGKQLMNVLINQMGANDILVILGGKINPLIMMGQVWRLLTPALLHASITHLAFNMYALYVIGISLESPYKRGRFLALYLLGALGGNTLSFWMTPNISVGASTAIFGLVAAEGVFIYQNRALFGARARGMLNNVIFIVIINLAFGLTGNIDNWGHLGGLLAGLAFAWFAGPRLEVQPTYTGYTLVDQRSTATSWLVAIAIAFIIGALALVKINAG